MLFRNNGKGNALGTLGLMMLRFKMKKAKSLAFNVLGNNCGEQDVTNKTKEGTLRYIIKV